MTRIVVAVDDSAPARAALSWAEDYLRDAPEPVVAEVLTIWAPTETMGLEGFGLLDDTGYPQESEAMLRGLLDELGGPEHFSTAVGSGRPVDSILRAAEGADLLVIGTRAEGPVRQALVGSMSQDVVGHAECPVAVVPEAYPDPGGRTVVAWDGTVGSMAALKWALEHRSHDKIDVVFVAVVGDAEPHELRIRDDLADVFGQDVADRLRVVVRFGVPSEQLDQPDEALAEIVMGDRAAFGPHESIWGSVTSHVLSTTRSPVVVVPAEDVGP